MKTRNHWPGAIFGFLIVLGGCSEEYDDPAIAICEAVIKNGLMGSFERTSAEINGADVSITYQVGALNTRSKTQTGSCKFFLSGDSYILDPPMSAKAAACYTRIDEIAGLVKDIPDGMKARFALVEEAEACSEVVTKDAIGRMDSILSAYEAFAPLGIYPIDPADTALSQDGSP